IGKPVILVSRDEGDIPFDLRHVRVITYEPELPRWDVTLREKIVQAAQQTFAGANIWPPPLVPATSGIRGSKTDQRDESDDGFPARPVNLGFEGPVDDRGYPWGWFDSVGYVGSVSTKYKIRV